MSNVAQLIFLNYSCHIRPVDQRTALRRPSQYSDGTISTYSEVLSINVTLYISEVGDQYFLIQATIYLVMYVGTLVAGGIGLIER